MTGNPRPDADEPGVLELLGFSTSAKPAPPASAGPAPYVAPPNQHHLPPQARATPIEAPAASSTRREAREQERRPAAATGSSRSAERRIRQVQKSYTKPKRGRKPRPVAPSGSTRPAPKTTRGSSRARTIGSRVLSVAAMIFAGALAVGMSVPANAFNNGGDAALLSSTTTGAEAPKAGQTLDVAATATMSGAARDEYTVTSWAEMLRLQYGTRDYSYEMGDPNGPIRWPFPYPVPISSGFGERAAPCYGCSSMHMGVDFTPGAGAPIYAIADGTVSLHDEDQWGFGNHVIIDHGNLLGDGNNIKSLYAHMQTGSSPLNVGDPIEVGDFIGTVGMTGTATGNHLHFEIHVNDVQVDPFAWLQLNT
jgi:murein DD-endopeptidase MepM/ murein hydrolase activator NlpD